MQNWELTEVAKGVIGGKIKQNCNRAEYIGKTSGIRMRRSLNSRPHIERIQKFPDTSKPASTYFKRNRFKCNAKGKARSP